MKFLSDADLQNLLPPAALLSAVEQAARALHASAAVVPARQHIEWSGNTLLTMPAVSGDTLGVKLVCVAPGNAARNLPVIHGLMVLAEADTGKPLAVLNAGTLTAQRTGAVGALGIKYMTPEDTRSVGIVGVGVQGVWQAIFACAVRPIRQLCFFARSDSSAERFISAVSPHIGDAAVVRCADTHELLRKSSLIITATTSNDPVLPDDPALLAGKHFISVGSFRPVMQELPMSAFRLAGQLAIDSEAARQEAGDVLLPVAHGVLQESDVFHIAELVTGRRTIDCRHTTVYKSVGMAIYDLFVARAFHEEAGRRNIGRDFEL